MEIDCVQNRTIHGSGRIVLDIRAASMSGREARIARIDRCAARPGYIESDDRCYREVEACESKGGLLTCLVMDVRLLQPIAWTVAPPELAGAPRCAVEHAGNR